MVDEQGIAKSTFGRHVDCFWDPNPAGQGKRARRGGRYRAFVPDPIAGRGFLLDSGASAALHQATKALERLQHAPTRVATLGAVAQNLLRSESVASSRIEGVLISHKRLARAAHLNPGKRRGDSRAAEVLGNVDAMKRAIAVGAGSKPITVADLLEIHRLLLCFTDDRGIAGVVRTSQNWIGGNDYNPIGAAFVPPPPEHVPSLLEDLCQFIERDDLPPIVQAAIAHAQFETIHPFADGNGRIGRALIYAILRRRGEVTRYIPPISLMLASTPKAYIGGLTAYREGDADDWCESFAVQTARAAQEAERLAAAIEDLEESWLERAGRPRQGSAARRLIGALPEQPVFDAAIAQNLSGRSHVAVNNALRQLEEAGILRRLNERKWGRAWECDELLQLVEEFEESVTAAR
ncbi:MAG TPA: Fic family protein [Solirubrobacterales bacterium]|nr:Fic family protein [Solirubrobacterales bacterium]